MNYANYIGDIVLRHSVILDGWPFPTMKNPSKLGGNLVDLRTLLEALRSDPPTCYWRDVTAEEIEIFKSKHEAAPQKQRKRRTDAGKKRAADEDAEDTDKENDDRSVQAGEVAKKPRAKKARISVQPEAQQVAISATGPSISSPRATPSGSTISGPRTTPSGSTVPNPASIAFDPLGTSSPAATHTTPSGSLIPFGSLTMPGSQQSSVSLPFPSAPPSGSPALFGTLSLPGSVAGGSYNPFDPLSLPSGSDIFNSFDENDLRLPNFPSLFPGPGGPSNLDSYNLNLDF